MAALSMSGEVLTNTVDIVERWKKHIVELFKPLSKECWKLLVDHSRWWSKTSVVESFLEQMTSA